jgi:uncharacterized damage-inducible protein DinB
MFKARVKENYSNLSDFLASNPDLNQEIHFVNMKGDSLSNKLGDILHHIFNHSTHHRAQILQLWSQKELERPPLDYIYYQWQIK